MEELVKIIECMEQYERIVIPVFYNVDPSHVRYQKRTFAEAFDVHKERYEEKIMQNWKSVLKKTANLSGIHYPSKYRNESELIQDIVKNISEKLSHLFSNAPQDLVGIDEHFKFLQPLMAMESDEVRTVGIWGMGGIGKTTIARAIFDRYASRYESCCFLENVREESQKSGKHSLYEKLISELLEGEHLVKGSAHARSMYVKRKLSRKKVLIVLDDVDALDKLDYLTTEAICLGAGSRVIVTTRDEQILIAKGVDKRYKVWGLSFDSSLELFCLKAFHKSCPENGYRELSKMAVNYTKGNPLALKVLGSFLHSRSIKEWESALKKLRVHPNVDIYNVLKLSYDGLDDSEKNIFLDIAFFFRGEYKGNVISFLDSCGFYGDIGISTLERKALITIFGNRIGMHDLIQQMGWEVVRRESNKDSGKLTRINKAEDFCNLLKNSEEKSLVEGIMIDLSQIGDLHLNANTFTNMPRLRFLKLYAPSDQRQSKVYIPTTLDPFPAKVSYLEWNSCPLNSLPLRFCAEKLVNLRMCNSQISQLWDGAQDLVNLIELNLGGCIKLEELPDFSKATKLKWLNLWNCQNLCQLHPSILSIQTLEVLSLDGCKKLKSVKSNIYLKSLKALGFQMCSSLEEFSVSSEKLTISYFSFSRFKSLPYEFYCSTYLFRLCLLDCRELIELPHHIKTLSKLVTLDVRGCRSLRSIPELPPSIEVLLADECTSLERIFSFKAVFSLNRRQISFENCVKLEEESLNDITEDAHLTIFRNVLSFLTGQYQMINYNEYRRMDGRICYPGYKVPEWFGCQTTEASITIELDQPYYQLLGFIFCCVVSQNVPPPCFNKWGTLNIRCEYGHFGDDVKHTFQIKRQNFVPERRRNSEDRVFIWTYQFPDEDMFREIEMCDDDDSTSNQKMSFRFSVDIPEYGKRLEERKKLVFIKGCGILPIYASTVVDVIQKLELECKLQLNPHPHNSITRQSIDAVKSKMIRKIKGKSHRLLKK
ncbi:disease resistance protein RPV1 isoform X1 [Arachis duranensis]|uniref:ADP-ribosyl cyclase/cyclic ADP-ribose hydrolase n=1 Tax=Arachis duranensis TaxID=130453 RepID=A0A6P5N2K0_ARADU|nr:disease resistance protein RPV1 isoform X1 [Arachis duranensis]XP_052113275.1 disease resistance protein RPV1 isoform X1 [Arachis duranensis]